MAAEEQSFVETRHRKSIYLNTAGRLGRLRFVRLPLPEHTKVRLTWMYTYDSRTRGHPKWMELKGTTRIGQVTHGGDVEFVLFFGAHTPDGLRCDLKKVCVISLERPGVDHVSPTPSIVLLPTLAYMLKVIEPTTDASDFETTGYLKLQFHWGILTYEEAICAFNLYSRVRNSPFLSVEVVRKLLVTEWDRVFGYLHKVKRGKHTEDKSCVDDTDVLDMEYPILTSEYIERMILIGTNTEKDVPSMISRCAFCGNDPSSGISIWRVLQTTIEMIGRSLFLRTLFIAGQLHLLTTKETALLNRGPILALGVSHVFFFRIPRTMFPTAAVVLECFKIVGTGADLAFEGLCPTPYITSSQLEEANGNPFIAFAKLESVHHDVLKNLDVNGLLQPPLMQVTVHTKDAPTPRAIKFFSHAKTAASNDEYWWASADLIPELETKQA